MTEKQNRTVHIVYQGDVRGGGNVIGVFGDYGQARAYVENYVSKRIVRTSWKDEDPDAWMKEPDVMEIKEYDVLEDWKQHPDFVSAREEEEEEAE